MRRHALVSRIHGTTSIEVPRVTRPRNGRLTILFALTRTAVRVCHTTLHRIEINLNHIEPEPDTHGKHVVTVQDAIDARGFHGSRFGSTQQLRSPVLKVNNRERSSFVLLKEPDEMHCRKAALRQAVFVRQSLSLFVGPRCYRGAMFFVAIQSLECVDESESVSQAQSPSVHGRACSGISLLSATYLDYRLWNETNLVAVGYRCWPERTLAKIALFCRHHARPQMRLQCIIIRRFPFLSQGRCATDEYSVALVRQQPRLISANGFEKHGEARARCARLRSSNCQRSLTRDRNSVPPEARMCNRTACVAVCTATSGILVGVA